MGGPPGAWIAAGDFNKARAGFLSAAFVDKKLNCVAVGDSPGILKTPGETQAPI